MLQLKKTIAVVVSVVGLAACSAHVDQRSLQGRSGAPLVSEVAEVSIPHQPGRPTAVVVVEPVTSPVVADSSGQDLTIRIEDQNAHLSQKLITALAHTGNISVVDVRGLKQNKNGGFRTTLRRGEKGPYMIRAVLTEFTEKAVQEDDGTSLSLGWIGVAAGIAGIATGKPGLGWSGLGVALADPKFDNTSMHREGMVAFDIQIVDAKSLRIIDAFKASGTFAAESQKSGFQLFGYSDQREAFAQSVLGQATQAAMNDAVSKIRAAVVMH